MSTIQCSRQECPGLDLSFECFLHRSQAVLVHHCPVFFEWGRVIVSIQLKISIERQPWGNHRMKGVVSGTHPFKNSIERLQWETIKGCGLKRHSNQGANPRHPQGQVTILGALGDNIRSNCGDINLNYFLQCLPFPHPHLYPDYPDTSSSILFSLLSFVFSFLPLSVI